MRSIQMKNDISYPNYVADNQRRSYNVLRPLKTNKYSYNIITRFLDSFLGKKLTF